MNTAHLAVDDLAARCAEETHKFTRQQLNDTRFCFELLRRALLDGAAEAFTRVYQIYEPQVRRWVYGHSRFDQTDENADYFVSQALSNFYFALRGPKFQQFSLLSQVLAYLKLCVHTAIAQHIRDHQRFATVPLEAAGTVELAHDVSSSTDASALWRAVCETLSDENDRLLAHSVFVLELKPAEIAARYPATWTNAREVSLALYRIRRALRASSAVSQCTGIDTQPI
jgi:hypothetical protein